MRKTVRSLSSVGVRILEGVLSLVREDRDRGASGVPAILPRVKAGNYAPTR